MPGKMASFSKKLHTYVHLYIYIYICVCVCFIYIYIHIYIYTYVQNPSYQPISKLYTSIYIGCSYIFQYSNFTLKPPFIWGFSCIFLAQWIHLVAMPTWSAPAAPARSCATFALCCGCQPRRWPPPRGAWPYIWLIWNNLNITINH